MELARISSNKAGFNVRSSTASDVPEDAPTAIREMPRHLRISQHKLGSAVGASLPHSGLACHVEPLVWPGSAFCLYNSRAMSDFNGSTV